MEHDSPDQNSINEQALEAVVSRTPAEVRDVSQPPEEPLAGTAEGRAALHAAELLAEAVREQTADTPPARAMRKAQAIAGTSPLSRFTKELDKLAGGARRIVAALDLDSRLSSPAHAFRGATEATQLAFSSEVCEVDIELDAAGDEWCITGQLSSETEEAWSIEIISASDERLECLHQFDASTSAPFSVRVPAGVFFLLLRRGAVLVELGPVIVP